MGKRKGAHRPSRTGIQLFPGSPQSTGRLSLIYAFFPLSKSELIFSEIIKFIFTLSNRVKMRINLGLNLRNQFPGYVPSNTLQSTRRFVRTPPLRSDIALLVNPMPPQNVSHEASKEEGNLSAISPTQPLGDLPCQLGPRFLKKLTIIVPNSMTHINKERSSPSYVYILFEANQLYFDRRAQSHYLRIPTLIHGDNGRKEPAQTMHKSIKIYVSLRSERDFRIPRN